MNQEELKKPVRYYEIGVEVQLGDHVETTDFFRKRYGRVVYVPGISRMNPDMEHDGLTFVGIQTTVGPFLAVQVHPATGELKKKVKFIKHDSFDIDDLGPDIELD